MSKEKIRAWVVVTPCGGFSGIRFGVNIFEGFGCTADKAAAASCAEVGYTLLPILESDKRSTGQIVADARKSIQTKPGNGNHEV